MSTTPDYWHDAKPILDAKCASCHTSGGIAPFMILTLADVEARAAMIRGSLQPRLADAPLRGRVLVLSAAVIPSASTLGVPEYLGSFALFS